MRHILRFVFFAILLALATSANAQECSTADQPPKTWNQVPSDPLWTGGPAPRLFFFLLDGEARWDDTPQELTVELRREGAPCAGLARGGFGSFPCPRN